MDQELVVGEASEDVLLKEWVLLATETQSHLWYRVQDRLRCQGESALNSAISVRGAWF